MKKGVVILGGLILGFALCMPALAQPSARAVETRVIDSFDTDDTEWTWDSMASRFVSEGYPIVKKFEGIPNSLVPFYDDSETEPQVLGVKVKFDRKGDNWFEIYPTKDDEHYEFSFLGTVTQLDFWVWGANYNYRLEVLIRDADGRVHVLKAGSLRFDGWKNVVVNIPGYISQHSRFRSGRAAMTFLGFRVRTDANEAVDDYVIYFDQLKYTSNNLVNVYDGYALRDADFGDSEESDSEKSSSSSSSSSSGSSSASNANSSTSDDDTDETVE